MTQTRILDVRQKILNKNDQLAQDLRADFARHGIFVANLVSSPGAGKTELLRRTLADLSRTHTPAAVTGDLATENDAGRLAESGALAKQILTGAMCHLEADMVAHAICAALPPPRPPTPIRWWPWPATKATGYGGAGQTGPTCQCRGAYGCGRHPAITPELLGWLATDGTKEVHRSDPDQRRGRHRWTAPDRTDCDRHRTSC